MSRGFPLHWQIVVGLILGVVVGLALNSYWTASTWSGLGVEDVSLFLEGGPFEGEDPNTGAGAGAYVAGFVANLNGFVGDLFLRALRLIGPPIVFFSLIVGIASLHDLNKVGRIGTKTIVIYLSTTAVAISLGVVLANVIGPGRGFPEELRTELIAGYADSAFAKVGAASTRPTTWEVLLNLVPSNPFAALAQAKMLQIITVALLIGISLTLLPRERAKVVVDFCDVMTEVTIKVVHMVLYLAPYAVFALIAGVVADLGAEVLLSLLQYSLVVVAGLGLMMFGVYPLLVGLLAGVGYGRFFTAISPAQLLAFSSASSGATIPVTMECCEERLGASEEVTSFVVPLGATINMDGTALYLGVCAVFIAQIFGVELTLADNLVIVLTATLASIGTAAVPGAGVIMMVIVLQAVGLPLEGIAVILGVDRILDMCRTSCNVTGDCMVTAVVAASEGGLKRADEV
ncbi:dicarboxylate/amino acid:cation symporter [Mucisphaera calidilacus]|uniref:Proton glutamate symport protein n=1 Tax=Mucisphaera calidilacus TaxID=2527982 RepID=A0A518C0K8_9BACT|nr:dicarboxylate/amino acid:cation symporter [Mucisphaera calidilacus]QDU72765.1 Proton glutamate symport protein [Mucisphaera calidilacus]